jgi:AAA domain
MPNNPTDSKKQASSAPQIISADERLAEKRGAKTLIVGPTAVGKTSLLRTLDAARTLFVDIEAGDLSVQDVEADTIRINAWPVARDLACRIGGPNPSFPPTACYSQAHHEACGGPLDNLDRYDTIFIDSITAVSRLSFRWAEQQPEAFSERTGKKDTRGAYGLHAREMIRWLHQLQHARGKHVIFVAILEKVVDEFGTSTWQLQMEGARTGRELPGIVDQIITMQWIDFGDGVPVRAFVCTSPNRWNYPAKDRAGRLDQIEEPHLGKLIKKLTARDERKPFIVLPPPPPEQTLKPAQ